MIRSVVTKLWLTICALVLGILLTFSLFLTDRLEKIYFSYQIRLMTDHAEQWKKIILSNMQPDKLQQEMEFWGKVSHYKLTVFDSNGIVLYSSDTKHSPLEIQIDLKHVKARLVNGEYYYKGYYPEFHMEMTAAFLPFKDPFNNEYLIMVHAPTDDLMAMIKTVRITAFGVLFLFLVLSGALVWYFSRLIAKPLIEIRKIAVGMAKGDFSTQVKYNRNDELGDLAKTMNTLSIRLNKTLGSLSRANSDLNALLQKWKEFVADVSHELRTPLFLIQGYSEAILDNVVKDKKTQNEYLAVITKETLRLQKIVNDLLAVESGLPLQKVETVLSKLIRETLVPFEIAANEKSIAIEMHDSLKSLPPVNVDPAKLDEVIYNLVDNALRHTPQKGKITIAGAVDNPGKVKLIVRDTGTGIPPEHLPYLFDRFYRVDKSRSRSEGGTGLGLAIVKKIVEQHGGDITVQSQLNKGTVFTISLPMK